jgi:hypothetical protein
VAKPTKINSESAWAEAQAEMQQRIEGLCCLQYHDLCELPSWQVDQSTCEGVEVHYTTYRETLPDGRVQIVVQACTSGGKFLFIKFSRVAAEGFRTAASGAIEPMLESDLYDFT